MNTTTTRVGRSFVGAIAIVRIDSEVKKQVKKQIVFIDARVEDYQSLAAGVVAGTEVVIIDPAKDGIKQITQRLRERGNVFSLHIISHSSPGCLQLGSGGLSLDNINDYAEELRRWSADTLLLYGCNVAAGDAGVEFVERLHQLTGAKVAASARRTGCAALGGDWELEVGVGGDVDVELPFEVGVLKAYSHVLPTFDWTTEDWIDPTLVTNTLTNPYSHNESYSDVDGSGISVALDITAEAGVLMTSDGQQTPDNFAFLQGGLATAPISLHFTIDPDVRGKGVQLTATFDTPVNDVIFQIYDLDKVNGSPANWQDEVEISAKDSISGNPVTPITLTRNGTSSYDTATVGNNIVLTGNKPSLNTSTNGTNTDEGNVTAYFSSPIQEFTLIFRDGSGAKSNPNPHTIALLSNFIFEPTVKIEPSSITHPEGDTGTTDYTYTVTLSDAVYIPVVVDYATSDSGATAGSDYTGISGSLTFAPGEITKTITVQSKGDTIAEPDEDFIVSLTSAEFRHNITDATIGDVTITTASATGTITDDDNNPPTAENDSETTDADAVLNTENVLLDNGIAADSDPDANDTLTVTAVNGSSTDIGNQITLASGALLTLNSDGTYSYNPNGQFESLGEGETDTDSFTYTISDGNGGTSTATVTITIDGKNDPPVVTPISKTGTEDTNISFSVSDFSGNYSDPENDALTKIQITSLPANGTLLLNGTPVTENQEIDASELANLVFDPDENWNGDTSFGWKGHDGTVYSNDSAAVNIEITAVNDPPVVTPISKTGTEDTNISFSVSDFSGNYSDPESDALTKIQITSLPANGTLLLNGTPVTENQEIDASELANLVFDPDENWNGDTSFGWKGHDGTVYSNDSAAVNIEITPVNDPHNSNSHQQNRYRRH